MSEAPPPNDDVGLPWRRHQRVILAVTFVIVFAVVTGFGLIYRDGERQSLRRHVYEDTATIGQRVGLRLQESAGPAYMMASLVKRGKGQVDDFETVAAALIELFPMAASIQLAPNAIVERIFPLPGNEAAIGHDILNSDPRRQEAHQAIAKRQLVLGGPYKLLQGGIGVIGRYPVFLPDENGWDKFWGFSTVIVHVAPLLDAAGIGHLVAENYRFEVCRVLEDGGCEVFSRRGEGPPEDPVVVEVEVPNGHWLMRVAPEKGWQVAPAMALLLVLAALLGTLVTFLQYLLLKRANR